MSIRSQTGWPAFGGAPADMIEIDQLVSAYAHSIDSNRFDDNGALFTDDAVFEILWQDAAGTLHPANRGKGVKLVGTAARVGFQRKVAGNPPALPRKKNGEGHQLINRIIDVQGDAGTVRCYRVGGAMQYEVDVTRTAKGWKFRHMRIIFDQDRDFPVG
jgi:hypothetical protein